MHITIHKDNSRTLVLALTPPKQITPRSKHYAIKTNWTHKGIAEHNIIVGAIETSCNLVTSLQKCLLKLCSNFFPS